MKYLGEMLLTRSSFSEIVTGNTALVRAMVEAGTQVVTSYPGSPTPEIATAIRSIPAEKRPFYFEFSTNEKVATEVAYGAGVNGHLSTVFFKSVGLNVAADTFVQLSLMNIIGGMVIVLGDDPGANSSQNEQDNRHYAYLSYTPMFEPADPTEVYQFYKKATQLSQEKHIPVILRMTTHVCHQKERITFDPWSPGKIDRTPRFNVKNGPYIPLTKLIFPQKQRALENIEAVKIWSNTSGINTVIDHKNSNKGIITSGLPFLSLMDILEDASEKPDILKLGMVYPLPTDDIFRFLSSHKEVKILEELDDEMEKGIKALAFDKKIQTHIIGKQGSEDWMGEYTPDKVRQILIKAWPEIIPASTPSQREDPYVPLRPAQLCPGCGHRSAFYAVKRALEDTDITVADIGCHTLGFQPPYNMGELLMCMGASTSIGAGLSLFNSSRKVVVFMGDSTFFHAALPGVANAVFNQHNITMILMENGTTAMTGHQDHAGTGKNFNDITEKISIRRVLESLGVYNIFESDAYNEFKVRQMVKEAVSYDGFSVVIAKHPCMLKLTRERKRKEGYTQKAVSIDQNKCDRVNECIEEFACPTFSRSANGTIKINQELCIGDGSCIKTCPVGAITPPKSLSKESKK